jgi:hypothetical protein
LLPSEEIRGVSRRAVLIGNRVLSAQAQSLKDEFGITMWAPWAVVLDGRGRLLGSWRLQLATSGCEESSKGSYAALVARRIEETLNRTATLEDVRQHWERNPVDASSTRDYLQRLEEMDAPVRAKEVIAKALAAASLSEDTRKIVRFASFRLRFGDMAEDYGSSRWKESLSRDGESLLVDFSDDPQTEGLPTRIFEVLSHNTFDVPAKSRATVDRLLDRLRGHSSPGILLTHIRKLSELRETWLADRIQALLHAPPGPSKGGSIEGREALAISLGDTETTIGVCSRPATKKLLPRESADWLAEAQEKQARQKQSERHDR